MGSLRIGYVPHPDSSPESEAEVLANVYAFILEAYESRKAAEASSGEDDAKGGDNEHGLKDASY
jgi:hypothetical protein